MGALQVLTQALCQEGHNVKPYLNVVLTPVVRLLVCSFIKLVTPTYC